MNPELRAKCDRWQRRALIAGVILMAIAVADGIHSPEQFFRSYLLGFIFWIGFPLGCAAFLMLHYLTSGDWGLPIKQPLEAGVRTLPMLAGLVVPLLFGMPYLFSWAHADQVAADPVLQAKHFYLNVPFFLIREAIYFGVWLWTAYRLWHWSAELRRTGDVRLHDRLEGMSGPGLVFYGLTITFFSIDWIMSLEPHWFSTIFGMLVMVMQVQVAIAFVILIARMMGAYEPVSTTMSALAFNDLGNLLLAFVMLWAYLSFSQFLIIWSGDLVKEIPWYTARAEHGWAGIALLLIVFFFAVPFALLLLRIVKRRVTVLARVAALLIVMGFVSVYWMIVPAFHPGGPRFYLLDFLLPVGMGACWLAFYLSQLKSHPLLPNPIRGLKEYDVVAIDPIAQARQEGYERSDANSRKLIIFLLLTGVVLVLVAAATAGFFKYLEKTDEPAAFLNEPFDTARPLPSGPRLQAEPLAEVQEYRKAQQQLLNSYGWVDRQNGVARMPIDQAMARLLERGLPARTNPATSNEGAAQPSAKSAAAGRGRSDARAEAEVQR